MSQLIIYFFPIIFFGMLFHWATGAPKPMKTATNFPQAYQPKISVASTNLPAANTEDDEEKAEEDNEDEEVEEEGKELNDIFYDDMPSTAKKLAIASRKSTGIRIESNRMSSFFIAAFLLSIPLF